MSWTQPVCIACWNRDNPDRQTAGRGDIGTLERCCKCGNNTQSGLYVRIDPRTVPFPREETD
jgi:hypothetical protein